MTTYIALLRKEPNGNCGAGFPDFPGCVTAGQSLEEVRRMAAEALELHIEGMLEGGEPIPEPSTLDAITTNPENRNAVAFLVEVARQSLPRTGAMQHQLR
jgi:predicted RNase H-like HicB family nuclease